MGTQLKDTPTLDRQAYSVSEVCEVAGVGRTTVYGELKAGRLRASKIGRRTIIRADDLDAWLRSLSSFAA